MKMTIKQLKEKIRECSTGGKLNDPYFQRKIKELKKELLKR